MSSNKNVIDNNMKRFDDNKAFNCIWGTDGRSLKEYICYSR